MPTSSASITAVRTTLDIADDVLLAAKEVARRDKTSVGTALSNIARASLLGLETAPRKRKSRSGHEDKLARLGICPLPKRGVIVTNEVVDRIRAGEGI